MEDINEILLHTVPNARDKQSYLQGWDFELKTYRRTCAMFERMEVSEQVCEWVTPSKKPTRAETNCDSNIRKRKEGEAT